MKADLRLALAARGVPRRRGPHRAGTCLDDRLDQRARPARLCASTASRRPVRSAGPVALRLLEPTTGPTAGARGAARPDTREVSRFGASPCTSQHVCRSCARAVRQGEGAVSAPSTRCGSAAVDRLATTPSRSTLAVPRRPGGDRRLPSPSGRGAPHRPPDRSTAWSTGAATRSARRSAGRSGSAYAGSRAGCSRPGWSTRRRRATSSRPRRRPGGSWSTRRSAGGTSSSAAGSGHHPAAVDRRVAAGLLGRPGHAALRQPAGRHGDVPRGARRPQEPRIPDRFDLVHVLSREPRDVELFSGRLDGARLEAILRALVPWRDVDGYWLCGPFDDGRGAPGRADAARASPRSGSTPSCSTSTSRRRRWCTPRRCRRGRPAGCRFTLDGRDHDGRHPAEPDGPGGGPGDPPRRAVRVPGRGLRHLPCPGRRGRGRDAAQLRARGRRARRRGSCSPARRCRSATRCPSTSTPDPTVESSLVPGRVAPGAGQRSE